MTTPQKHIFGKHFDGPLYSVCLPGSRMPHLYDYPRTWMPPGHEQIPKYVLEESYSLSDASFADVIEGGKMKKVCWIDHANNMRPHERPAPAATPGFWEILHLENSLVNPNYNPERLRRMLINVKRYIKHKPDSDARVRALERKLIAAGAEQL